MMVMEVKEYGKKIAEERQMDKKEAREGWVFGSEYN